MSERSAGDVRIHLSALTRSKRVRNAPKGGTCQARPCRRPSLNVYLVDSSADLQERRDCQWMVWLAEGLLRLAVFVGLAGLEGQRICFTKQGNRNPKP